MVSVLAREIAAASFDLDKYSNVVADLDGTLVDGRIAQGQGKYFLKDELKRGHIHHVVLGLTNYSNVKKAAEAGEAEGLEYFFRVVAKTGCAREDKFYQYAKRYIEKHSLPHAKELIEFLTEDMPIFISTVGSKIAARAASEYYGGAGCVGNPLARSADRSIAGIRIEIRDGKDKLEATREMMKKLDFDISEGIAIGNDRYDHELMKASALAMASPLADEETVELVRGLRGIVVEDYLSLLEELRAK